MSIQKRRFTSASFTSILMHRGSVFQMHARNTTTRLSRRCEICREEFCFDKELAKHIKKSHPLEFIQCEKCLMIFDIHEDLRYHREVVHKIFACKYCSEVFSKKSITVEHQQTCRKCKTCGERFKNAQQLSDHICSPKEKFQKERPEQKLMGCPYEEFQNSSVTLTRL